jgi:hypothetical protein
MSTDEQIELHPTVIEIASKIELENGKLVMSEGDTARYRARLTRITAPSERKLVLVSLVALGARLMREADAGSAPAVARLMDLAAVLIGDAEKAKSLFSSPK